MKQNVIINQFRYAEELFNSSALPEDVSANTAIYYFTNYNYMIGKSLEETLEIVINKMETYNLRVTQYQRYLAIDRITKYYNALSEEKMQTLRNTDFVPIYKSEYDNVMSCNTDRERKMLFTLYVLARVTNRYGWVYQQRSDIYKLANTSHADKKQTNVFYSLFNQNKIKRSVKVDDTKIGVELSDGNEEVVMNIEEVSNLGAKLMAFVKDDCILCQKCGKLIKIKSKNDHSTKYCKKCSGIIKNEQNKEYYHNKK